MPVTMKTEWNGDEIGRKANQAMRLGLEATAAAMVAPAMAATPVKTGTARGSISFRPAEARGKSWVVLFGSFDVGYFKWLEIGHRSYVGRRMLQNAVSQEWPSLAGRIKGFM
jgi:hypothetical protein